MESNVKNKKQQAMPKSEAVFTTDYYSIFYR